METEPNKLPVCWGLVSLGEVAKVEWGNTSITKKSYVDKGVVAYSATGPDGYLAKPEWFGPGVVLSAIGAQCGKCFWADGDWATIKNTIVIQSEDHFLRNKFLFYFLNGKSRWKISGSGQPFITLTTARENKIPFPPLAEQDRIVAKTEELFSELDDGIESLKTAREQLKVYRQALLKHAFEGKLTAHWRENNKDRLESFEYLITQIKQERETQHLMKMDTALKAGSGRSRPLRSLAPLTRQLLDELPQLPKTWLWEKLGWMTCGVEYGTAAKSSESGAVPVLRMGNIQNAKFDWSDLVYTSDVDEIAKYSLQEGDVLFNRTNSPELVGKTAVYRGELPALFAGYLIRVNQIPAVVDCQYLNLFLNSHIARQHGNRVKTDGVNQSNINGEKLSNYPFPYCSLAEQREVVKLLEEKLSVVDQMEADTELEIQKADALRESILKKAFSGKLIAQDPNDEPAAVLLDRIRAEKAKKENGKKNNGRRKAA